MSYTHVKTFSRDNFRLDLWDTGRVDGFGKTILRYALFDETQPFGRGIVFEGEDFACSCLHAVDSDATVAALLGFLSIKRHVTARQLAWRDSVRADDLALIVFDLEH